MVVVTEPSRAGNSELGEQGNVLLCERWTNELHNIHWQLVTDNCDLEMFSKKKSKELLPAI